MICFSAEMANENAGRIGRELSHAFFDQLEFTGLLDSPMMVLRVEIVLDSLLRIALERNEAAQGETVEITIQTIGGDGVCLTVKDHGGKAACIARKHVDQYVDSIDFVMTNGGVIMRALFKWKTC